MHGCLLGLLIGACFVFFSTIINIVRLLTGVTKTVRNFMGGHTDTQQSQQQQRSADSAASSNADESNEQHRNASGRFFDSGEGDYVDFEEIDDNSSKKQ